MLIDWLNAAIGSKSYWRVCRLIRSIQAAETAMAAASRDRIYVHVGNPDEIPSEKVHRRRELNKLFPPIEAALKGYEFHPRLTYTLFGTPHWWFDLCGEPVPGDYKLTRADGRRVYEADAVFGVLRLASCSLLERVKQCLTCQKWLYASRAHRKFCSNACQLKYFASTPQQKEKRAAYMRGYRRREKTEDGRALHRAEKVPLRRK